MRKNKLAAEKAVKRDLTAIALPTKLPLKKIISMLEDLTYQALKTGNTERIQEICQKQLLALLDANTEVAVLKGGRRGQLSAEKIIDEPLKEIMPVRLSLDDNSTIQAQGTADYLKRISGIDPTKTNDAFKKQNAVLIKNLSKEISDRIKKTIVDLTEQGVHIKGGKTEIANILLNAGIDPAAAPKVAETIFRTQSAAAYNAGRWNIVNDPDTKDYIWGFEYVTAHDRRVRPEHRLLEGVRLPKEDPFWQRFLPPNGWNCRCTVLEIWNDEDIAKIDFGITGVDPRKRSIKELNLLPAFDGNVGVLAGEGHKAKIGKKGAITDTRRTYKPTEIQALPKPIKVEEPVTLPEPEPEPEYLPVVYDIQPDIQELSTHGHPAKINLIVDVEKGGKEFVVRARTSEDKGKIICRIQQKGVSFETERKVWRVVWKSTKIPQADFVSVKNALNHILDIVADKDIKRNEILITYKVKGKTIADPKFPVNADDVKRLSKLGGSTGAELVEDAFGDKMVRKTSKNVPPEHVENEVNADNFYRAMGIDVPECKIYKNPDGTVVKLSNFIEGGKTLNDWWSNASQKERDEMRKKLLKGYAVDVILNARDVVGANGDNILVDKDGKPWRIDNGGTMSYRAQGARHKPEDWDNGFPDELLTMTDDNFGSVKQKYFGKVPMLEAVKLIAERTPQEWDKAIAELPEKDRKVVKKRLEECLQLAERGKGLSENNFSDDSANNVLEDSYELSKQGFREAVPDKINLGSGVGSNFGYFRTAGSQARPAGIIYQDVWDAIEKAAKSINYHNKPGGDMQPNQSSIADALSHKADMESKANAGDKDAKVYLDYINKIDDANQNKTQVPIFTPQTVSSQTTTNKYAYSSLTDWLHTQIKKDGGDAQFVIECQGAQAGNSYSEKSCEWKIIKAILLGLDFNQSEDKILKDLRDMGFYIGGTSRATQGHEDRIREAIQALKAIPKDELEKRIKAVEVYIAGVQLMLENCDFPGNDKKTKTVICGRTENDNVISDTVKDEYKRRKKPVLSDHKTGIAESHFINQTVVVGGGRLTSVRAPYSRISGLYFCERVPGGRSGLYYGDIENEFNVTTNGLPILYQGTVTRGKDFEPYRQKHIKAGY